MTNATPEGTPAAPAPAPQASTAPAAEAAAAVENGAAKAEGFVSRNWGKVKDNFRFEEGNKLKMVGRSVGVTVGAGMTVDAFVRAKDSAGEDRSFAARALEGGTGLLLAGASARMGGR